MKTRATRFYLPLFISAGLSLSGLVYAADDADLAQKLANPIASLISIPMQVNYDENLGAGNEGTRVTTNIQSVIPFEMERLDTSVPFAELTRRGHVNPVARTLDGSADFSRRIRE